MGDTKLMIQRMTSQGEIAATYVVMHQLRPHLSLEEYLEAVTRMQATDGFRLAAVVSDGIVDAVAGYRTLEMLYCGRILSIDDLVVDENRRSSGLGRRLLDWLKQEALALGCGEIHLDSRLQREDAHRFYAREQFNKTAFHFAASVGRSHVAR